MMRHGLSSVSARAIAACTIVAPVSLHRSGGSTAMRRHNSTTNTSATSAEAFVDVDAALSNSSLAMPAKVGASLTSSPADLVAATGEAYNIFDKRNMKKTSPLYTSLVAIGIQAKDASSMELVVKDANKFNRFAEQVRTGKALIPPFWRQANALRLNLSAILKMRTKGSTKVVLPKAPGDHEPEPEQSVDQVINKMKQESENSTKSFTTPADVAAVMLQQLYAGDESCLLFSSSVAGSTTPKGKKAAALNDVLSSDGVGTGAGSVRGKVTQSIKATRKTKISEVAALGSPEELAAAARAADQDNEILKVVLNEEQKSTLNLAKKGLNMYIGGSAGTGKTVVLRAIKAHLSAMGLSVGMTATTGIAACNVNGSTFHHALSVDLNGDFMNPNRLLKYDCIIIDEISMMDQGLLHKFDQVMQDATGLRAPFGGVQIICSGDFLQLECVSGSSIYLSSFFQNSFTHIKLRQQVRQADHPRFAEQLSVIRKGEVPEDLAETVKMVPEDHEVKDAVFLMPRNKEVDEMNRNELEKLDGEAVTFDVMQQRPSLKGDWTPTISIFTSADFDETNFFDRFMARMEKQVDVGAALQPNEVAFYRFAADGFLLRVKLPPVTEPNRRIAVSSAFQEMVGEGYFDLLLDTKSRVMDVSGGLIVSIDRMTGELNSVPGAGNDVKTLTSEDELTLTKLMDTHPVVKPLDIKIGCRVLLRANLSDIFVNGSVGVVVGFAECTYDSLPSFMKQETEGSRSSDVRSYTEEFAKYLRDQCGQITPMLPVVKFGDGSGDTITVPPWEFSVGGDSGTHFFQLGSYCLPLTLAYAFTVHKVQGLTLLGRVHIKLAGMWKCHHLMYVAMSRVKDPNQLTIAGFEEEHVSAESVAVEYDEGLKDPKIIKIEDTTVRGMWTRDYGNRAAARILPGDKKKKKKKQNMYDNDLKNAASLGKESDLTKNLEEMIQNNGLQKAAESAVNVERLPEAEVVEESEQDFSDLGEFSAGDMLGGDSSTPTLMPTTPEQDRAVQKGLEALDTLKKGTVMVGDDEVVDVKLTAEKKVTTKKGKKIEEEEKKSRGNSGGGAPTPTPKKVTPTASSKKASSPKRRASGVKKTSPSVDL